MSKNILKKFGNRVREERIKQKLSQEELAEKAGVHRTYIYWHGRKSGKKYHSPKYRKDSKSS